MNTIETEVRFTMRMDNSLYEKLKVEAVKNKRSIAKEIEFIVEEEIHRREANRNKAGEYLDLICSGNATPEQIKEIQQFFGVI